MEPTPGEPWEEERRSRWWVWALVAFALAAIAVGAYFTFAGKQASTSRTSWGARRARRPTSRTSAGWRSRSSPRVSDDVPRDEVISQDPPAGDRAKEGATITAVISSGKGEVPVPSVEGQSEDDAVAALRDAGFKTKTETAFSDTVPEGDVISTSPEGGTSLTKGRTVTITVSKGASGVAVPKLVGLQQSEAEAQLDELGLTADVTEQETTQPPGTVMEQDPPAAPAWTRAPRSTSPSPRRGPRCRT